MKTNNKKKIVVSTLALAMGAALAGSISGSVAWYQYSTRAAALVQGTSVGTLGRLQLKSNFGSAFSEYEEIAAQNFRPVSIKNTAGELTWYDQPVYQVPQAPLMLDTNKGYVDYTFQFKFETKQDNPAAAWADGADRNVYLSHFAIVDSTGDQDVSSAVRVAILGQDGKAMKIFSQASAAGETATKGSLDLNKNNVQDTDGWNCKDDTGSEIEYTNGADKYTTDAHSDLVLSAAEQADIYDLDANYAAKKLCKVSETLTLRVWLEGWAKLPASAGSATWADTYLKQNFNLQLQFMCQADRYTAA